MADETQKGLKDIATLLAATNEKLDQANKNAAADSTLAGALKQALPEILSDRAIQKKSEKFDKKEGVTEIDEAVEETTKAVKEGTAKTNAGMTKAAKERAAAEDKARKEAEERDRKSTKNTRSIIENISTSSKRTFSLDQKSVRERQNTEIAERKRVNEELAKKIGEQGGVAKENAKYIKESYKIQKEEFKLRLKNPDLTPAAEKEIRRERRAAAAENRKTGGLMRRMAGSVIEGGRKLGKTTMAGLGAIFGVLGLGGALIALGWFFNSKYWAMTVKWIFGVGIPKLKGMFKFLSGVGSIGEGFGSMTTILGSIAKLFAVGGAYSLLFGKFGKGGKIALAIAALAATAAWLDKKFGSDEADGKPEADDGGDTKGMPKVGPGEVVLGAAGLLGVRKIQKTFSNMGRGFAPGTGAAAGPGPARRWLGKLRAPLQETRISKAGKTVNRYLPSGKQNPQWDFNTRGPVTPKPAVAPAKPPVVKGPGIGAKILGLSKRFPMIKRAGGMGLLSLLEAYNLPWEKSDEKLVKPLSVILAGAGGAALGAIFGGPLGFFLSMGGYVVGQAYGGPALEPVAQWLLGLREPPKFVGGVFDWGEKQKEITGGTDPLSALANMAQASALASNTDAAFSIPGGRNATMLAEIKARAGGTVNIYNNITNIKGNDAHDQYIGPGPVYRIGLDKYSLGVLNQNSIT